MLNQKTEGCENELWFDFLLHECLKAAWLNLTRRPRVRLLEEFDPTDLRAASPEKTSRISQFMSFDTGILFAHVVTAFAFITPHNFELTFNNDTKGDADGYGDGHAFTCAPKNFLHWCLHSHARPVQKKSFVFVVLGMGISYSNVLRWYRLPYRCTVFRAHLWPSPF
jgi:hypothetical protein